jgi:hypothetical protein
MPIMGARQSREMTLALKLVKRGKTPAIAGKRYGLHATSVRLAMRRAGMRINKPGRPKL